MGNLRKAQQGLPGASAQPVDSAQHSCSNVTCNKVVPPAPASIIGTCPYYTWRRQNFLSRHVNCEHTPPSYYLSYGYKYCIKFSTDLYPKLSSNGKDWLDEARTLLQVYMEQGLQKDMSVELDDAKFKQFAFDTHPDAYWDAGFADLSYADMVQVGRTPDTTEWLDASTWKQAKDVAGRYVQHEADRAKAAAQIVGETIETARETIETTQKVADEIRKYFQYLFK